MKQHFGIFTVLSAIALTTVAPASDKPLFEKPTVIPRAAWNARAPKHAYEEHTINRITIHHQAVIATKKQNVKERLRNMQYYHQSRQFADIAYHFIIDRNGIIYEGRPLSSPGETRTGYNPSGHLLICVMGDFDRQYATYAQRKALVALINWALEEFGLSKETIKGHRDYAATTCPGKNLYYLINTKEFKDMLKEPSGDAGDTEGGG